MPKIHLKPNSPEFIDQDTQTQTKICDMPGCCERGEYKAPKGRDQEGYYWFCLEHVREYNNAWDYFAGMSEAEVEDQIFKANIWDRPTWKFDTFQDAEEMLRQKAWQNYNFTDKDPESETKNGYGHGLSPHSPEFQALCTMGLEPPTDLEEIKARYKELAKKYHPDRNQGDPKSEELLKSINMAYTILKLAYQKYDELEKQA